MGKCQPVRLELRYERTNAWREDFQPRIEQQVERKRYDGSADRVAQRVMRIGQRCRRRLGKAVSAKGLVDVTRDEPIQVNRPELESIEGKNRIRIHVPAPERIGVDH